MIVKPHFINPCLEQLKIRLITEILLWLKFFVQAREEGWERV